MKCIIISLTQEYWNVERKEYTPLLKILWNKYIFKPKIIFLTKKMQIRLSLEINNN